MSLMQILLRPFQRGPRRPLAARRPEGPDRQVPLGMEALDLDLVDKVNRRNSSLERANAPIHGRNSILSVSDLKVDPMPEDETYAKRFHQAFHNKGQPR